MRRPAHILPVIIVSQFACSSVWFAGNAVVVDLQRDWGLPEQSIGYIITSVQLGFILGTLLFAVLAIADRYSPSKIFCACAMAAACANLAILFVPQDLSALLALRFFTGFFLAGVYPVGIKIAASWYAEGLGRALGYLVGALVLGTAFPHLIRGLGAQLAWSQVLLSVSILSLAGALLLLILVPNGPHLAGRARFAPRSLLASFRQPDFRASACGYFGHMWELYTFWTFVPVWLLSYARVSGTSFNVPLWTFCIIAAGFIGCVGGGLLSKRLGSARVAVVQLFISGACCVLSPWFFQAEFGVCLLFLLLWGVTVAGDSPQFSALNARNAPPQYVGSALTFVNSLGFLLTVVSIELANLLLPLVGERYLFWLLIPGPLVGLWAMRRLVRSR
jgi:MFS family permease